MGPVASVLEQVVRAKKKKALLLDLCPYPTVVHRSESFFRYPFQVGSRPVYSCHAETCRPDEEG